MERMSQPREGAGKYRVLEEFRYEIRRFLNFSERAARAAGVEPHQHQALLSIQAAKPGEKATVGFLAERMQVQHHSAVELSNRLEENGLIRRTRSGVDRREVLLSVTRRGEEILQKLSELHRTELRTTGPRLLKALQAAMRRANAWDAARGAEQGPPRIQPSPDGRRIESFTQTGTQTGKIQDRRDRS
jgi:DNA-binding MarR family transcriptional regulator